MRELSAGRRGGGGSRVNSLQATMRLIARTWAPAPAPPAFYPFVGALRAEPDRLFVGVLNERERRFI